MRLIGHIMWKDVRRLRWQLALWGVVILAQYAVWHAERPNENAGGARGVTDTVLVLWGLHLLLAWLLVPQVLEDDSLAEERAAWRTRPISAGRMMAAKVGGILLMVAVWPSVLTLPWWLEYGFGAGMILWAMAVNAAGMALLAIVALMIAVLAEGLARFIAWSIALGFGLLLCGAWLAAGLEAANNDGVDTAVLLTRAWLVCGVMVATAAVVVPWQFLTRRPVWARGFAGAMAVGVGGIVPFWPWSGAQVWAKLGGEPLPSVTARMVAGELSLPFDTGRAMADASVTTEFTLTGLASGDLAIWKSGDPTWRIGERRMTAAKPLWMGGRSGRAMRDVGAALVRGETRASEQRDRAAWSLDLPGRVASQLRNGEASVSARYRGMIWRGRPGPAVPLRVGAEAARGWEQIHVHDFYPGKSAGRGNEYGSVAWWQTGPMFEPTVLLELINASGVGGNRFRTAMLLTGQHAILDEWPQGDYRTHGRDFLRGRTPVGVVSVVSLTSNFDRRWRGEDAVGADARELLAEGATLASVTFEAAAPLEVKLGETPFVPDLVVEGRWAEAVRRAKAEEKPVLVRVRGHEKETSVGMPSWWQAAEVRELLAKRWVCVQLSGEEAQRWRKKTDEAGAALLVVLNADGEELDRWRDLSGEELRAALQAGLSGKTYAAVLMAALAARGGDDRGLRYQLHSALRARGELAGALDAIMWMVDHPREATEGTEIFEVGWRLQRFVQSYGAARAALLERRERAIAALRADAGDAGAARLLFVITLGLRHDGTLWNEFPRLLPSVNPLWWEFMRQWVGSSVAQRRYREVTAAVELEKFFAEGPAWVRAQLLARRTLSPGGPVTGIGDWQRLLVQTGVRSVEALVGAGEHEAALRLAGAVARVDGARATRELIGTAMTRAGAKPELIGRFLTAGGLYGR